MVIVVTLRETDYCPQFEDDDDGDDGDDDGGEVVEPEGRVDGPVVPGGEECCPHVVDQVNNFYLQQSSQLLWR